MEFIYITIYFLPRYLSAIPFIIALLFSTTLIWGQNPKSHLVFGSPVPQSINLVQILRITELTKSAALCASRYGKRRGSSSDSGIISTCFPSQLKLENNGLFLSISSLFCCSSPSG